MKVIVRAGLGLASFSLPVGEGYGARKLTNGDGQGYGRRNAAHSAMCPADDLAAEELHAFSTQRRSAVLLQASATIVGVFLPLLAVVFYLALAIFYVIDPIRLMRARSRRRAAIRAGADG